MRLVTWNARRGKFLQKSALLEPLLADIAVIQEIAAPAEASPQILWYGENRNQGMAVVARAPYTLTRLPELEGVPKYIVPVAVSGPRSFTLFAVWTLGEQARPYVQAACTAIDMYTVHFESTVVLLGDFNSNAIWNKEHRKGLNHEAMVDRLRSRGLTSAYHSTRGVEHGVEPTADHTFHLYGHEEKSFHIDYCFLPEAWASQIEEVAVGDYATWHAHSDHRPLVVSMRDAAA